jgi:hypothetical protein
VEEYPWSSNIPVLPPSLGIVVRVKEMIIVVVEDSVLPIIVAAAFVVLVNY